MLKTLTSRDRAEILRAAIQFAGDSAPFNQLRRWDVTALAGKDGLIVIFVIDRRRSRSARERWAGRVRGWNLRIAALGGEPRKPLPNGQFA